MPKFKKESDTKWVGTGESHAGCCTAMMHNKGDSLEIVPRDKPMINWAARTALLPARMHKVNVKIHGRRCPRSPRWSAKRATCQERSQELDPCPQPFVSDDGPGSGLSEVGRMFV